MPHWIIGLFLVFIFAPVASAHSYDCRDHAEALSDAGLTKCLYPFGILIAADERFPDPYVDQAAQILAQFIDANRDGQPDHPLIFDTLKASDAWLPMPWDQDEWPDVEEEVNDIIGFGMIAPKWWMDGEIMPDGPTPVQNTLLLEEVTHLYTEFGLALAYPAQFGVDRYDQSVLSKETMGAWCDYWQHPENNCPGKPAEEPEGDCSDVACNATEFIFGVVANLSGNDLGNAYPGLARTGDRLRAVLSPGFLRLIDDPAYGLPMRPFAYDYPLDKALR